MNILILFVVGMVWNTLSYLKNMMHFVTTEC